jgi:hypothetical protein
MLSSAQQVQYRSLVLLASQRNSYCRIITRQVAAALPQEDTDLSAALLQVHADSH